MNAEGREARDREIELLFLAGNKPQAIADLYDLKAVRVRRILKERGHSLEHPYAQTDDLHSVWDLPDAQRRFAIWERQHEAAREALHSRVLHSNHKAAESSRESIEMAA